MIYLHQSGGKFRFYSDSLYKSLLEGNGAKQTLISMDLRLIRLIFKRSNAFGTAVIIHF